ncbi:MAG: class I SAM-dependent methyltransferase [Chromatiales bacterium]|nr:class I SAM-dependent methyltransferase [Chromatiales bacterium]
MSADSPRMPAATMPGMIPTLNDTGFMTDALDAFSARFAAEAGQAGGEVLDIGCAYGVATLAALEAGARVCAADVEPGHLSILEARTPSTQRERLRTVVACMPAADFPHRSFAAILAARVLHFLRGDEIECVIGKMFGWLMPGGRVFLVADSPYVGPWYKAWPEYEARKRAGDLWPGFIEDYSSFLPPSANLKSRRRQINPLDPDILERVAEAAGFLVEEARWLEGARRGSLKKTHAGLIARRPAHRLP